MNYDMKKIVDVIDEAIKRLEELKSQKTVAEILADNLTKEEYYKACNYLTVNSASQPCKNKIDAIKQFHWIHTEEGFVYWASICGQFERGER